MGQVWKAMEVFDCINTSRIPQRMKHYATADSTKERRGDFASDIATHVRAGSPCGLYLPKIFGFITARTKESRLWRCMISIAQLGIKINRSLGTLTIPSLSLSSGPRVTMDPPYLWSRAA